MARERLQEALQTRKKEEQEEEEEDARCLRLREEMSRMRAEQKERARRSLAQLEKSLVSTLNACLQGGASQGENDIEVCFVLASLSSPRLRADFIHAIQQYTKVYKFKGKA